MGFRDTDGAKPAGWQARLPSGWTWLSLGTIRSRRRTTVDPAKSPDATFELYSVPSFVAGKPEIVLGRDIGSTKQIVHESDVLVCKINPRINRVWIVGNHSEHCKIASTEWIVFNQVDGIDPRYLCHFLQLDTFRDYLALNVSGVGGSLMRVRPSVVDDYQVPLAPYQEQRRIVAKIEELFSRLDAGIAALKRVQAALKRYRAAVLKAACEGRLVPQDPNDEPASKLLERILAERRAQWEAGLRAKGKDPRKVKYVEPQPPDTTGLPELPEGWCWATLEQLSWHSGYGTSQKCDYGALGPPVLRIPNIVDGTIGLDDLKFAFDSERLEPENALAPNDLLIIRTNGSRNLIGRCALVKQPFARETFFASYLIRYRLVGEYDTPIWLSTIWNADDIRRQIELSAATSAGQYNVSVGSLNRITIPLPPALEQKRILPEIDRRLSVVDGLEQAIVDNLTRAERLRQSILQRAFEGKLVPQDPNDEPASALLERIRSAPRAVQAGAKRTTRRRGEASATTETV